ncbi:hypothetical protein [Burkholderia sp. BCC1998]|uniref:hypothetical protein n=1 Tax=Burkholderia sp. BCC1998 TaxID=2817447 RepID=UPI002AB7D247|nr:hypothetical protein [Burkholderia sp. BCC1998]
MKQSRIDQLISDQDWKRTCIRVVGMVIAYFAIKYLPMAIDWGAKHWNIAPPFPQTGGKSWRHLDGIWLGILFCNIH